MATVSKGDTIKVHYTGKLDDESVFDSSYGREPLEFTVGSGQVIAGFDSMVVGMEPGDKKTTVIPATDAYGPHEPDMVAELNLNQFPDNIKPEVGQQLQINQQNGQPVIVQVIAIVDGKVTLDANHPLAGKDLTFEIELVEIV